MTRSYLVCGFLTACLLLAYRQWWGQAVVAGLLVVWLLQSVENAIRWGTRR